MLNRFYYPKTFPEQKIKRTHTGRTRRGNAFLRSMSAKSLGKSVLFIVFMYIYTYILFVTQTIINWGQSSVEILLPC